VGNLTDYSLNTSFSLYEELKAIVSKTIGRVYPERRPENNKKH